MTLTEKEKNEENGVENNMDYRRLVINLKDLIIGDFRKWIKEREDDTSGETQKSRS